MTSLEQITSPRMLEIEIELNLCVRCVAQHFAHMRVETGRGTLGIPTPILPNVQHFSTAMPNKPMLYPIWRTHTR